MSESERLQICISKRLKEILKEAVEQYGFSSVSDLVRFAIQRTLNEFSHRKGEP